MRKRPSLVRRFRRRLRALGLARGNAHVLVAVSGGADSVALLHLLRFHAADFGILLSAAHFDHAMRPGSDADARWVQGLCAAWDVPLAVGRASRRLRSEADAREVRYAFLHDVAAQAGATLVATAHHADDQAETVLFRILRGTGPAGLAGIADLDRESGLVRPLLPFWRSEIRQYARKNRLRWREDATNRSAGPARNRIRLELLPWIERTVAPGARRSLVRLAGLARDDEAAWERALAGEIGHVEREEEGRAVLVRPALAAYDSAVAARLLRSVLRRFGIVLGRTGTRTALRFICTAPSGRVLELPGGARIATEFDLARVERAPQAAPPPDEPLEIGGGDGEGVLVVGGARKAAAWRSGRWDGRPAGADGIVLPLEGLALPLVLRGWRPGDRVRTPGGTKTLKKLFGEARVPRSMRARVPVLADAGGAVLWVAGLARAVPPPRPGEPGLTVDVTDA
ncbi:MAG TPA: tRNA lysidine(34) synthetase TilS [Longimicrobium sp.]|nr:tRNA lysidine(34) synthetase TilS [Longimicrobium sp.]